MVDAGEGLVQAGDLQVRVVTPQQVWNKPAPALELESFVAKINEVLYEDWTESELGTGSAHFATGKTVRVPDELTWRCLSTVDKVFQVAGWSVSLDVQGASRTLRFFLPEVARVSVSSSSLSRGF